MDAEGSRQKRIEYSPLAADDFSAIHDYTAHHWGWDQAERYADFLEESVQVTALEPSYGRRIEGHPEARAAFVKWKGARYGHNIIYRETAQGIYVLRILHSAMDMPGRLGP